jgi:hypothetical protein
LEQSLLKMSQVLIMDNWAKFCCKPVEMESLQTHFASRFLGISLSKAVCAHCDPTTKARPLWLATNKMMPVAHSRQSLSKWSGGDGGGDGNDTIGCASAATNHGHFQAWFTSFLETSQFEKCVGGCLRAWFNCPCDSVSTYCRTYMERESWQKHKVLPLALCTQAEIGRMRRELAAREWRRLHGAQRS